MNILNLKENDFIKENNWHDDIIEGIKNSKVEDGTRSEFMAYVYYKAIGYEVKDLDYYENQEQFGDILVIDGTTPFFTVDSKNSCTYDNVSKLGISLSHWDKDMKPYNGVAPVKDTNYSWLHYLNKCDKIACYNNDLRKLFIIEDWQSVRNTLLSKFVTKDMKFRLNSTNSQLNNKLGYKALDGVFSKYDNEEWGFIGNKNVRIDYSVETKFISLMLKEEVLKELGSDLTIVQIIY